MMIPIALPVHGPPFTWQREPAEVSLLLLELLLMLATAWILRTTRDAGAV